VHGDYLFNFAIGQWRDASVAEDLVQDTFLAAFKARDRFAAKSSERTWLVGILPHKIYDHLRHTCRERATRVDPNSTGRDEAAYNRLKGNALETINEMLARVTAMEEAGR
jgi:RNA polymerase sigma-70 factor (ECF subfamily)